MWPDNETNLDFVNFGSVANTVAEVIVQAEGRPISIGVSGAWGVGKSSMIKLIEGSLRRRDSPEHPTYVFVEFNAWLYQGYDDARASLMEVIAESLKEVAQQRKTGVDKARELLSRVNWLRVARFSASSVAAVAMGLSPVGLIGEAIELGKTLASGGATEKTLEDVDKTVGKASEEASAWVRPKQVESPPKEIHEIRRCFEETLQELEVTLVVLIDDLDRCLPETTISTLEAIRLFLFLQNTAFVIAADDAMIKHAVRRHFSDIEDRAVTSYFDKLVQVPMRVPPLGTQEVRAYMMLLYAQDALDEASFETVRSAVCAQLAATWEGKRVDPSFFATLGVEVPGDLMSRLHTADRIAPLMTTVTHIAGNPRLIKRFMNAIAIRMAISNANGIGVDEGVLAKMLLFERCGHPDAYAELVKAVNNNAAGRADFLSELEAQEGQGQGLSLPAPWDDEFVREWLTLRPPLADVDLRGVLYVSREHVPLITPEDQLSAAAADLLSALIAEPSMAEDLREKCGGLTRSELGIIMDRLIEHAHREQEWGVPPILTACLTVARADATQGLRLAEFLKKRPTTQLTPAIVPKIGGEPWARDVYSEWKEAGADGPARKAINSALEPQ